jgi:multidrug resistance protein
VLPRLVEDFLGGDTPRAAAIFGAFGTVWALMQFICSPIVGALSDHVGRRPVVLLSCLGLGLDYVFMALAPSLGWLFVGRVISGIASSSIPTAFAYIADITPTEKRAASFGMVGAAFGLGFVLGPALGGILGSVSPRLPFWVAAVMALANALYGFFVLLGFLRCRCGFFRGAVGRHRFGRLLFVRRATTPDKGQNKQKLLDVLKHYFPNRPTRFAGISVCRMSGVTV